MTDDPHENPPAPPADAPRPRNPIDAWVDKHGDYLFRVAYSRLHDRWVAEDVVQETFLAAMKARFDGRSAERTWLVGILKRKIVDHLRIMFRESPTDPTEEGSAVDRLGHNLSGQWEGHWDPDRGPVSWGPNPATALEDKEFWVVLDRCLKGLTPRLAAVFTLYEMEEIPAEEICRDLAISPTNLWVMLHRARKQLRHCLEQNWFDERQRRGDS